MKVTVVSAIGGGEIPIAVEPNDLVRTLKEKVAEEKRIPASTVIVVFRGTQLDDNMTLEACGVGPLDKLYLITRTEGGSLF